MEANIDENIANTSLSLIFDAPSLLDYAREKPGDLVTYLRIADIFYVGAVPLGILYSYPYSKDHGTGCIQFNAGGDFIHTITTSTMFDIGVYSNPGLFFEVPVI